MPNGNQLEQQKKAEKSSEIHAQPVHAVQKAEVSPPPQEQQKTNAEREEQRNRSLSDAAHRELPAAQADSAAPGSPVQTEAPPKQSVKTRIRSHHHAKKAKKACPVGTAATYDMVSSLRQSEELRANALAGQQDLIRRSGADIHVLSVLCRGYKTDKKGNPSSKKDRLQKEADDAVLSDYCSLDVQRRAPHLDRLVGEVMKLQHSAGLFSDRYVQQHLAELKEDSDRLAAMEKALADPVNAPYFLKMDITAREHLEMTVAKLNAPFQNALRIVAQKNGVNVDAADYYGYASKSLIDAGRMAADSAVQTGYAGAVSSLQAEAGQLQTRHQQRVRDAASEFGAKRTERFAVLRELMDDPALQLTQDEKFSREFSGMSVLLGPREKKAENLETLRTLTEVHRLNGAAPSLALFDRVEKLLGPRVQKILDCDVDWLAGLSDEELIERMSLLNELATDADFVQELSELRHPTLKVSRQVVHDDLTYDTESGSTATVKELLARERSWEYDAKLDMVRALAQKARALSLLREQKAGALPNSSLLWLSDTKSVWPSAQNLEREAQEGRTRLRAAHEQWKNRFVPGTLSSLRYVCALENNAEFSIYADQPLMRIAEYFQNSAAPDARQVYQALSGPHYASLAYSKEELRARGLPETIGEPLFRSLKPFAACEAAKALMTPEAFRQMVLDFAAGHIQTQEQAGGELTDEAHKEACRANERAVQQYKRVMTAQYDMLARKYGNEPWELTFQDITEHFAEIKNDFLQVQVHCSMVTRYPDFIDQKNPEDLLLKNRVLFFNYMGMSFTNALNALHLSASQGDSWSDVLMMGMSTCFEEKECDEAADYLTTNDRAFCHPIDWSQKVR